MDLDFLFHSSTPRITMVSKVLIALMALVVVASAFEMEVDEEFAADMEFMKRDPVMQEFYLAEKRGQSMRKYKPCDTQVNPSQTCWCSRRGGKFAFCSGAGNGAAI
ncbi:uncharacterized protein [Diadema antillarum]|uniref:uncharacterized protein n=1 Tax=Diadema antillarum TaxID=105358 RepID=UPI003A89A8E9